MDPVRRLVIGIAVVSAAAVAAGLLTTTPSSEAAASAVQTRPNIVLIETDDQTAASIAYMPKTLALIGAQGATFDNSFVTYSLCCPSRSTVLTGQYAHNHGVLGNAPPSGGYAVFKEKHSTNNLAVWLQRSGYYTALVGKFLNGYGKQTATDVPPGWSEWHGGVDLSFLGGSLSNNGQVQTFPATEQYYQTDNWSRIAQDVIKRRAPSTQPFFLWLTPHVPHNGGPRDDDDPRGIGTTRPPARYKNRFASLPLPMPPSFNEADVSDKPVGIRNRPALTDEQIAGLREAYQQALEADLGVDDLVAAVIARLRASGELANTLLVFTSDNGFFYGEHRVPQGKVLLYEPSIRVPLLIRGPGVPKGLHLTQLVGNIDLAPTIVDAAGAKPGLTMDGRSLYALFRQPKTEWGRDLVIENGPSGGNARRGRMQQFAAVRTPQYLYASYVNGERELYDLDRDPYELQSRQDDPAYQEIARKLAARLAALRTCAGAACSAP
jgi:N-acetylglucosamine-6-sulfatase